MKKLLFIILLLEGLSVSCFSNPVPNNSLAIQEIYIKNDSVWKIDLYEPAKSLYYYAPNNFDSIEIKSSSGSVIYNLKRNTDDKRLFYVHLFDSIHHVLTLTVDSFNQKLHINHKGDYVVFKSYFTYNGFETNYYDSISFGNIKGAKYPALDSTKSIMSVEVCGAQNVTSLSSKPDIGEYSEMGIYLPIKGVLYDFVNKPLVNKTFFLYDFFDFSNEYYCSFDKIVTDGSGHFISNYFLSDFKKIQSTVKVFDTKYNNNISEKFCSRTFKTKMYQLDSICNIYLFEDITDAAIVKNSAFSLYPNPATSQATLKYDLATIESANVEVLDIVGNIVERFTLQSSAGILQLQLGSKYSAGMYVVQVKSGSALLYSQDLIVNK